MTKEFKFLFDSRLNLLVSTFNDLFALSENTVLIGGAGEPFYAAARHASEKNRIYFTRDYFSSALHEIAHWCIAGSARRRLDDYGYWYAPDGRTVEQQSLFESVEVKPQALERLFARASAQPFRVSADNLLAGRGASQRFVEAIHEQTLNYCRAGLPRRGETFLLALMAAFDTTEVTNARSYSRAELVSEAFFSNAFSSEDWP